MLEEYGLEPMIAANVEETRQILERMLMQVVFSEDRLLDGGFREIVCLVKANRPEVQVVVSSMLEDVHEYIEAMSLGAFDFIAPRYRSSEIISVVHGAYRRYRLNGKMRVSSVIRLKSCASRQVRSLILVWDCIEDYLGGYDPCEIDFTRLDM